ncbi:MAG: helix-turn-helix transcriptional regulator [Vicinamibacterales bacterium]
MTDISFGARLRHERERRGISLASIAANTKIATPLLQALEHDDVSRWPGGIYRRSFVKAYAEAVGLDATTVTREFLDLFPDPAAEPPAPIAAAPTVLPGSEPAEPVTPQPRASALVQLSIEKIRPLCRGGRLLPDARQRLGAVASDLGILAFIGLAFATTVGEFWMPLCIAMTCYYLGGILVLGNTPGVCLFAAMVKDDVRSLQDGRNALGAHDHSPMGASPAERC